MHYQADPIKTIGMDVETDAAIGNPKLIGFYYPESETYTSLFNPTLDTFCGIVNDIMENDAKTHLVVWGMLDIQCIIRLFNPTEEERLHISRGISGNVSRGEIIGDPPILRIMRNKEGHSTQFFIRHYIPGRSLQLGMIKNGRDYSLWVFNISQFYPGTIAQTAKGLHLPWFDFPKDTHIIDWSKFLYQKYYQNVVYESNKQDAKTVTSFSEILQHRFFETFKTYPRLLVSNGSLTDASVSKMLSDKPEDYYANAFSWLAYHVWRENSEDRTIRELETLLSEAFSAGYVDQFAIGFFDSVSTADISAAYPHKIRQLPDLRYSRLSSGQGQILLDVDALKNPQEIFYTAIIRGKVTIPTSLHFHPITIKTYNRENIRPSGTFNAAYTFQEREFCRSHGAIFQEEEYVIVYLSAFVEAPIADVSKALGKMRDGLLHQLKQTTDENERLLYDGQQYMIKVVDNSIYGKTVMTTEIVENDENKRPQIVGYNAGDRFNMLYGTMITAFTRIQIAITCMQLERSGARPIMVMTDAVYWLGDPSLLSTATIKKTKTPGFFEPPKVVRNFYLLKTGQYEYQEGDHWTFKVRGLNIDYDLLHGNKSFYHRLIKEHCQNLPTFINPAKITIPVATKHLISIGSKDLEHLGAIIETEHQLKPFVMSQKQSSMTLPNWRTCIDNHIWLDPPHIQPENTDQGFQQMPLTYLKTEYNNGVVHTQHIRSEMVKIGNKRRDDNFDRVRILYLIYAMKKTGIIPPPRAYRRKWSELEAIYHISREEFRIAFDNHEINLL